MFATFYAIDEHRLGYLDQQSLMQVFRLVFKRLDEKACALLVEIAAGEDKIVNVFEFFELMDAIL